MTAPLRTGPWPRPSVGDDADAARRSTAPIAVLLVDDHTMVARAFAAIIDSAPDIAVVGVADDGETRCASPTSITSTSC